MEFIIVFLLLKIRELQFLFLENICRGAVILGAIFMRNYDILFDRSERQIHFTKANCSKDLDKLIWNNDSQSDSYKSGTKENFNSNEIKNNTNDSNNSSVLNLTDGIEKTDEQTKINKTTNSSSEIDKNYTKQKENLNLTIQKNDTKQNTTINFNNSKLDLNNANATALLIAESTERSDVIGIIKKNYPIYC